VLFPLLLHKQGEDGLKVGRLDVETLGGLTSSAMARPDASMKSLWQSLPALNMPRVSKDASASAAENHPAIPRAK
jgi:hypothetical protein